MTAYINGDFISLDEHNTTFSVMVEDKGKIAYIGYNIPLCYRDDAKQVDLEGKAVIPAVNSLIEVDAPNAACEVLQEGESADFAILNKNILKEQDAEVLQIFIKGKEQGKGIFARFHQ